MLKREVEVAGLAQACARAGILTEDLILRRRWKSGYQRWRNADAEEGVVAIVPVMVQAGRPKAGLLHGREISSNGIQCHIMEMTIG